MVTKLINDDEVLHKLQRADPFLGLGSFQVSGGGQLRMDDVITLVH